MDWDFVYVGSNDGNLYAIGNLSSEIQTITAAAQATATADAQSIAEASATAATIELSWDTYLQSIGNIVSESANSLPGIMIEASQQPCPEEQMPASFQFCGRHQVSIAGGSGKTWVALAIYASKEASSSALEQMEGGLQRSGWQEDDVDGLAHEHVCLTLVHDETSQAICYMTRDDALIVGYSYLSKSTRPKQH